MKLDPKLQPSLLCKKVFLERGRKLQCAQNTFFLLPQIPLFTVEHSLGITREFAHHPVVRPTDKVDALEIQIHHRDPGAARNPIFNSVLSPMVVINFTLINFVYFDLSLLLSNQYGGLKRSAPKFGTSKTITKETDECFHLYLSYFTSVT